MLTRDEPCRQIVHIESYMQLGQLDLHPIHKVVIMNSIPCYTWHTETGQVAKTRRSLTLFETDAALRLASSFGCDLNQDLYIDDSLLDEFPAKFPSAKVAYEHAMAFAFALTDRWPSQPTRDLFLPFCPRYEALVHAQSYFCTLRLYKEIPANQAEDFSKIYEFTKDGDVGLIVQLTRKMLPLVDFRIGPAVMAAWICTRCTPEVAEIGLLLASIAAYDSSALIQMDADKLIKLRGRHSVWCWIDVVSKYCDGPLMDWAAYGYLWLALGLFWTVLAEEGGFMSYKSDQFRHVLEGCALIYRPGCQEIWSRYKELCSTTGREPLDYENWKDRELESCVELETAFAIAHLDRRIVITPPIGGGKLDCEDMVTHHQIGGLDGISTALIDPNRIDDQPVMAIYQELEFTNGESELRRAIGVTEIPRSTLLALNKSFLGLPCEELLAGYENLQ